MTPEPAGDPLFTTARRPSRRRIESALNVLGWLSEHTDDGADRDEIGHVRYLLDEVLDDA